MICDLPYLTGADAEHAVMNALTAPGPRRSPALKRNTGNFATFSPARQPTFRVNSRLVRSMVEAGRLEWVNACRSAARLPREAAE